MQKLVQYCGNVSTYAYTGLFVTSFMAQVIAGLAMVSVILLGLANFFN